MAVLVGVVAFALGLAVGSFLNVVVYRGPRHQSVVRPRSFCPACGTTLAARDNIPVLSFIILRGRCRTCGARISWRYPAIELATAFAFLVVAIVVVGS